MARNLSRNTRLFVSTQDLKVGDAISTMTSLNTFEIRVLDGYSYTQDTATQEVGISEAGNAPVRGQRQFNTALNPAEVSFGTYIRPFKTNTSADHTCVERPLWGALVSAEPDLTVSVPSGTTSMKTNFERSDVHELLKLNLYFVLENTAYQVQDVQLNTAEIDFSIDAIASITWGGSGISVSEQATFKAAVDSTFNGEIAMTGTSSTYAFAPVDADYIKNKLSTVTLVNITGVVLEAEWTVTGPITDATADAYSTDTVDRTVDITVDDGTVQNITISTGTMGTGFSYNDLVDELNYQLDGAWAYIHETDATIRIKSSSRGVVSTILVDNEGLSDAALFTNTGDLSSLGSETTDGSGTPKTYNVPITGGSLSIDNGITYLTPEELGIVNKPIGSFTGMRGITGTLTAYLNTGTLNTGGLLADLLADDTTVTHEFDVTINIGGATNTPKVSLHMPHANLVIPTISVEDVISTEIGFAALGDNLETPDELYIEYIAATEVA